MRAAGGGGDELREQLNVLWRRKWWIVGALVLTLGVAGVRLATETPQYRSSANVLLRATSSIDPVTGQPQVANAKAVQNEAELARSSVVSEVANERLGFAASISVAVSATADQIAIQAVDADPARAAEIADTFADAYIDVRREQTVAEYQASINVLQPQISAVQEDIRVVDEELATNPGEDRREVLSGDRTRLSEQLRALTDILDRLNAAGSLATISGPQIIDRATPAAAPFEPQVERTLALAAVVGLILGLALAFIAEYLDDTVKTAQDLERVTGRPTLASIPRVRPRHKGARIGLFSQDPSLDAAEEATKSLRTAIQFLGVDREIRSVVLTSPRPGEGKTTTAANLAAAFADAGKNVVALSTDLRKPRLHEYFGVSSDVGLSDIVLDQVELLDAVPRLKDRPNLAVLPSGPVPPNPAELLSSASARRVFELLAGSADLLVFDSPPLLPVADGLVLAAQADATVLVASYGTTRRRDLVAAMEALGNVGADVIGCVLTSARGGVGYGYGYGYDQAPRGGDRRGRRRGEPTPSR